MDTACRYTRKKGEPFVTDVDGNSLDFACRQCNFFVCHRSVWKGVLAPMFHITMRTAFRSDINMSTINVACKTRTLHHTASQYQRLTLILKLGQLTIGALIL
jgi:hypothetical protein